jgi:photosystem II stability/assembly factor-like uncharacterized protein
MTMNPRLICALALLASPAAFAAEAVPISDVSHIHGIAFDAANVGVIFLATHYGVFRTTADGTAEPVSTNTDDYMGFTPHPTDANLLFASGHPATGGNLGVIVSRDGGVSWTQVAEGENGPVDFHAMTISRADPQTIYGLFRGIQVSHDGGASWSTAGPGPDGVIDLAASAEQRGSLYAGTVRGLWMSADAGTSWAPVGPENIPVTMVEAAADGAIYAFFAGNGLFRKAADSGEWTALADNLGSSDFLHMAIDPLDAAHLVAVTQDSQILESRDGGKSWAPLAS